ncbi:MAG: hypothetical protein MZU95_01220 [Desulfomicrobium escambiense]|nr:hypothetical protein [Desulfomicrobium escambiense]
MCPVWTMLKSSTPIRTSVQIGEDIPAGILPAPPTPRAAAAAPSHARRRDGRVRLLPRDHRHRRRPRADCPLGARLFR